MTQVASKIYSLCGGCGGTGISNDSEGGICPGCNGTKVKVTGYVTEAVYKIEDLPDES